MSAKILKLPEPMYRPDLPGCFALLDGWDRSPGKLFDLARLSLNVIEGSRGDHEPTRRDCQRVVNGMAIACFALALELGIPREMLTSLPVGGDTLPEDAS
jgi:hypothetical protein